MPIEFIKHAFSAGEISPQFLGRSDLEKYDLGVEKSTNNYVDYRGGLSNRPGSEFGDYIMFDGQPAKMFRFSYSPDADQNYIILFGHEYIRFIQNNAYVLEFAMTITGVTSAAFGVFTAPAHGYATGDWVKVDNMQGLERYNGQTFVVTVLSPNTFYLSFPYGAILNTSAYTYVGNGIIARIYTVPSTYLGDELEKVKVYQYFNQVRITHENHEPASLTRLAPDNWVLADIAIGNSMQRPVSPAVVPSAAGTAGAIFAVTAIGLDGTESLISDYAFLSASVNYAVTAGSARLSWAPVPDAKGYNVYRSLLLATATELHTGMDLGYIGTTVAPQFTDNNIIPDFATTPPQYYSPFEEGAIEHIDITAPGAGYTVLSTVSIADPTGSGFIGMPIVSNTGTLIGILIIHGGHDYSAPVVNVTIGAGATFSVEVSALTGENPRVTTQFQNRAVYGSTPNQPLTIFGSRPYKRTNFDVSRIINAGDSYEYDLEQEDVAPIEHLVPMRNGLLAFTGSVLWRITSGDGLAVTAVDAFAEPQSYSGCSPVPPLNIGPDLLYIEGRGTTVRLLTYNDNNKVYGGQDVSVLSNHLFTQGKDIIRWAWADEPHKLAWGVRRDGKLLSFTMVKEQNVFGWAPHQTRGLYKDVCVIRERFRDVPYFIVSRFINGRWTSFFEAQASRDFTDIEDAWFVDCGLSLGESFVNAYITPTNWEGEATINSPSTIFNPGNVGWIIRAGGGKAVILEWLSAYSVRVRWEKPMTQLVSEDPDETILPIGPNEWSMSQKVNTFTGLEFLEGQLVSLLGDGNVFPQQRVVGGRIVLPENVSKLVVGLGYRALVKPLPLTSTQVIIESKRKVTKEVFARFHESRGVLVGDTLDHLYAFKERTNEDYGQPTDPVTGIIGSIISGEWRVDGQIYLVQDDPLPMSVLSVIQDVEIGDDSN